MYTVIVSLTFLLVYLSVCHVHIYIYMYIVYTCTCTCTCVCVQVMEEAIKRLERRHKEHIILYDPTGVSEREKEGGGRKRYVHV